MKKTRILGGACFVCLIGGAGWFGWQRARPPERTPHVTAPVLGNSGTPKGDPANAIADFKVLYKAIDAFRTRHHRLPAGKEVDELGPPDAWTNPDTAYGDQPYAAKRARGQYHYMMSFLSLRADGTPKPAFPRRGEKDVWLVADQYVRYNQRQTLDKLSEMKLEGSYVVLWSDGTIEQIPLKDQIVVWAEAKRGSHCFKGEAGIPKGVKVQSIADMWRAANVKVQTD